MSEKDTIDIINAAKDKQELSSQPLEWLGQYKAGVKDKASFDDLLLLHAPATIPTIPYKGDALDSMVAKALREQLAMKNKSLEENAKAFLEKNVKPLPTPAVELKTLVLKNGEVAFTTLTDVGKSVLENVHKLKDFGVSVNDVSKLHKDMVQFVPKVKKSYNIQVKEAHSLLMAWQMNEKCLITGPTGSGKSSLIEHCCALTNRPYVRVNMSGDIESSVLFGQLVVEGGATVWKDGPVTEAVKNGAVLLLDEWDVTPPEILFGLQWLFEENGKLFIKEMPGDNSSKFLIPHEDFRLVCAGNTVGQGDDTGRYSGTNVQNNASIDRFQTTIVLNYLSPDHEEKIIQSNSGKVAKATIKKMVSFANMVRTAYSQNNINLTMSPRTLINWGNEIYIKVFGRNDDGNV
jgi:cobaltochelatase CobS